LHHDATISSEAVDKRPVILQLHLGLPRSATVHYSIEPDGAFIRGYSWTPDPVPLDDYQSGYFYCEDKSPAVMTRVKRDVPPEKSELEPREPVVPICVAESILRILDHFGPAEKADFQSV